MRVLPPPPPVDGYGLALVQTLLALGAVCALAWVGLRVALRGGLLRPNGRHITVLERTALGPRRALYLVRVGERVLLLGASDASLCTLAELRPDELSTAPTTAPVAAPQSLLDALLRRPPPPA